MTALAALTLAAAVVCLAVWWLRRLTAPVAAHIRAGGKTKIVPSMVMIGGVPMTIMIVVPDDTER